jgi:hypothetical protein
MQPADNDGSSGIFPVTLPADNRVRRQLEADNDEECSSYGIAPAEPVEGGATVVSAHDRSQGSQEKKRKAR